MGTQGVVGGVPVGVRLVGVLAGVPACMPREDARLCDKASGRLIVEGELARNWDRIAPSEPARVGIRLMVERGCVTRGLPACVGRGREAGDGCNTGRRDAGCCPTAPDDNARIECVGVLGAEGRGRDEAETGVAA
jgi:hypothetical protein